MIHDLLDLPASHHRDMDESPESARVRVVLLDRDDLPMARGSAMLPLSLGVGMFWPDCPMPPSARLVSVKCFSLPGGEKLHLKSVKLCDGQPPHYEFRMALG
jgi:hypothetical protein